MTDVDEEYFTDILCDRAKGKDVAVPPEAARWALDAIGDLAAKLRSAETLLQAQVKFTEQLRVAANRAVANASHINQNYCGRVPPEKMSEWAEAKVAFNLVSVTPSPASVASAVVRSGPRSGRC